MPMMISTQSLWTIFLVFLRLGLTSFGGPTAHLGYFRDEFVIRRKWLNDAQYADTVALCQFYLGQPVVRWVWQLATIAVAIKVL